MGSAVDFKTIIEMFDRVTTKFERDPRPLLMHKVDGAYRGISFRNVRETVERFALGLSQLGVRPGDMIGLISENRPEWVVADMGLMCLGAVSVPVYPTFTPKQIEFIFNDAGVKFAIVSNQTQLNKLLKIVDNVKTLQHLIVMNDKGTTEDKRVNRFSALLKAGESRLSEGVSPVSEAVRTIQPHDLLTVIYTSGTTGEPKGVMLTHGNITSNVVASVPALTVHDGDECRAAASRGL